MGFDEDLRDALHARAAAVAVSPEARQRLCTGTARADTRRHRGLLAAGALGAVLAVRSLFGFGAGAASPLAAGIVLDVAHAQSAAPAAAWGLAFGLLGLGGVGAAACAARLRDGRRDA